MKKYTRKVLKNSRLDSITDQVLLSKCLPGITKSDLVNISDAKKIDTLVKMVNASLVNGVELSSAQVIFSTKNVINVIDLNNFKL